VNEADSIIKFSCENCGQKFSVHKNNTGKKGKCPKCKNIITIPKAKTQSPSINQSEHGADEVSSNSPDLMAILQKNEELAVSPPDTSESSTEYEQESEEEDAEEATISERLPWFINIFLYPRVS